MSMAGVLKVLKGLSILTVTWVRIPIPGVSTPGTFFMQTSFPQLLLNLHQSMPFKIQPEYNLHWLRERPCAIDQC